jgi:hypothetical protein
MVKMANNGNATIHHDLVLRKQAELLCPLLTNKAILMKLFSCSTEQSMPLLIPLERNVHHITRRLNLIVVVPRISQ